MEHSLEKHLEKLNKLCRICGSRSWSKQKKNKTNFYQYAETFKCKKFVKEIMLLYRLDICKDIENKHSQFLCAKCYRKLTYFKSQTNVSEKTLNEAVTLRSPSRQKTFGLNTVILPRTGALPAHISTVKKVGVDQKKHLVHPVTSTP